MICYVIIHKLFLKIRFKKIKIMQSVLKDSYLNKDNRAFVG